MSVHTSLRTYFDTQWSDRTKIVFPNTSSEIYSGSYTDTETVLEFFILQISSDAIGLPVTSTVDRREEYLLQINIMTPKNIGDLKAMGHVDQLNTIFRNKSFTQDSISYHFRSPVLRPPLPNELVYDLPWECEFFIFV